MTILIPPEPLDCAIPKDVVFRIIINTVRNVSGVIVCSGRFLELIHQKMNFEAH